ncbi:MAG TPA: galactokinase [Polyangiaceae bacterium]
MNLEELVESFEREYGGAPRVFRAPGRVNLIGEHTDYNDGFVLPVAIEASTYVLASHRPDRRVRATSLTMKDAAEFDLSAPGRPFRNSWLDYVEGTARALLGRGVQIGGANLLIASDIPPGAGLSASAALEIAVGLALSAVSGQAVPPLTLALAGQQAEHEYVGTRCGIMDQYVVAHARARHALLIDCRELTSRAVPFDLDGLVLILCDTRTKHELAFSAYNQRREECERAVAVLARFLPGIRALRDVGPGDFEAHRERLDATIERRTRHVIAENERTLAAADALARGDMVGLGRLMTRSHESLRDDFEVSSRELDVAVAAALEVPGVCGSRMTGGGFGGSTVSLVRRESVEALKKLVAERFESEFGRLPEFLVTAAGPGAEELVEGP